MAKYTEYFGNPRLPLGIRNNNPGNIEWGSPWQGLVPAGKGRTSPRFAQFVDPVSGIRAIAVTLITYYDKRKANDGSKIDSVREVIERWAPANDKNDVKSYAAQVAKVLNVRPESENLNLHDYKTLRGLVEGIIRHENGDPEAKDKDGNPKFPGVTRLNNANQWYPDEVIDEALRRAGVAKPVSSVGSVPVTKTTAAAGTAVVAGTGQLLDVGQPVIDAVRSSQDNITSGQWVRIGFGVVTIAIGVWLAYVQYRKYKAGQSV